MRWFRGRAEKKFKSKYRTKTTPAPARAPEPKYKSPAPTKRVPKLRKPQVRMPFVDSSLKTFAENWVIDQSHVALRQLLGRSVKVKWVSESASDGCDDNRCASYAAGDGWDSVEDFLEGRTLARSPKKNLEMGIYGYSHPGCDCHLVVSLEDGSVYTVSVDESVPAMISGPKAVRPQDTQNVDEEQDDDAQSALAWGLTASTESVEDELGSYGNEEESLW